MCHDCVSHCQWPAHCIPTPAIYCGPPVYTLVILLYICGVSCNLPCLLMQMIIPACSKIPRMNCKILYCRAKTNVYNSKRAIWKILARKCRSWKIKQNKQWDLFFRIPSVPLWKLAYLCVNNNLVSATKLFKIRVEKGFRHKACFIGDLW